MKSLSALLAAIIFGLTGCMTTDEDPYPNIRVVDAAQVTSCKHIGNLSSSSTTPYGFFTETANESILKMAKKEGYKLGATHIVLDTPLTGDDLVAVNGKAYVCP